MDLPIPISWITIFPLNEFSENDMRLQDERLIPILHHYGHGSFGVQCSWGSALSVYELIKKRFESA
jgi:hypothetical protein